MSDKTVLYCGLRFFLENSIKGVSEYAKKIQQKKVPIFGGFQGLNNSSDQISEAIFPQLSFLIWSQDPQRSRNKKKLKKNQHFKCVFLLPTMCHMSRVTCQVSHVSFFKTKQLSQCVEGLLSQGHTPSSQKNKKICKFATTSTVTSVKEKNTFMSLFTVFCYDKGQTLNIHYPYPQWATYP